jgi:hypothetical protein
MDQYFAFARNDRPGRARAARGGAPGGAVMDRAGRVHILPWARRPTPAGLPAWCAQLARRIQSWWRGRGAKNLSK